jgi:hypothetical protein
LFTWELGGKHDSARTIDVASARSRFAPDSTNGVAPATTSLTGAAGFVGSELIENEKERVRLG